MGVAQYRDESIANHIIVHLLPISVSMKSRAYCPVSRETGSCSLPKFESTWGVSGASFLYTMYLTCSMWVMFLTITKRILTLNQIMTAFSLPTCTCRTFDLGLAQDGLMMQSSGYSVSFLHIRGLS